jgi:hypothetical protein
MGGMGGAQGMGGGMAGMLGAMQWTLGMPNDRVLVMTRLPGNKLETLISSPDPKSKLSSQLATAVKNVQDAPLWFAVSVGPTDRKGMQDTVVGLSKTLPSLKPITSDDGGPLKELVALQGKMSFTGADVDLTLGLVFTDGASATKMADGLKKVLGQGKEILASFKGNKNMKKETWDQLEAAVKELLGKVETKAAGTACEISMKLPKAQIDQLKALAFMGR